MEGFHWNMVGERAGRAVPEGLRQGLRRARANLPPWTGRVAGIGLLVLALALLVHALLTPAPTAQTTGTPGSAAPAVNHYAPDVTLRDASGNRVPLSSLRGKVVVLNFWYASCAPCQFEMPALQRIYDQNRQAGLVVVGVDVADDAPTMSTFANRIGITYPVFVDEQGRAMSAYQLADTPSSFIIDRAGVIRYKKVGPVDIETLQRETAVLLTGT